MMEGDWTIGEIKGKIIGIERRLEGLQDGLLDDRPDIIALTAEIQSIKKSVKSLQGSIGKVRKALEDLLSV